MVFSLQLVYYDIFIISVQGHDLCAYRKYKSLSTEYKNFPAKLFCIWHDASMEEYKEVVVWNHWFTWYMSICVSLLLARKG